MFAANSSFRESGIAVINSVDSSKFPLLVTRLAHAMQVSEKTEVFSQDELSKLESSLGMEVSDLKILLDSINLVLTQAALTGMNSESLKEQLEAAGVANEKAAAVIEVWNNSGKQIIESLKLRLSKPQQLDDIRWSLGATISSKGQAEQKSPHAILQFTMKNEDDSKAITVQMNHEQLFSLHQNLQNIQDKLDSLK